MKLTGWNTPLQLADSSQSRVSGDRDRGETGTGAERATRACLRGSPHAVDLRRVGLCRRLRPGGASAAPPASRRPRLPHGGPPSPSLLRSAPAQAAEEPAQARARRQAAAFALLSKRAGPGSGGGSGGGSGEAEHEDAPGHPDVEALCAHRHPRGQGQPRTGSGADRVSRGQGQARTGSGADRVRRAG